MKLCKNLEKRGFVLFFSLRICLVVLATTRSIDKKDRRRLCTCDPQWTCAPQVHLLQEDSVLLGF